MPRRARLSGLFLALAWLSVLPPLSTLSAEPIVVMSYNVRNWLQPADDDTTKPKSGKPEAEKNTVADIIATHRPDILGLVEMGTREDLEDLRARLKARDLDYPHAEWHEGFDSERHVALLSRFPIATRDSQNISFALDGLPRGLQRGLLDVTVEPRPGYRLRLLGLHLKSRRPVPNLDEEALRAKEAWFVRQYLDRILAQDPETKLLVFGDFNTTRNEYPVRQIQGPARSHTRLSDLAVEDAQGERWTHYFPAADEYSRIDYLMVSLALRPDIDLKKSGIDHSPQWNLASDHRAIYTTIKPK